MARRKDPFTLRKHGAVYHVRFSLGGRQWERSTKERSRDMARERAREIYEKAQAQIERSPATETGLSTALEEWFEERKEQRESKYVKTIQYQARGWCERWTFVHELDAASIAAHIRQRLKECQAPTVRKELNGLRRFLLWCQREKIIAELPSWETPSGRTDYEPPALSAEEIVKLLSAIPNRESHKHHHPVREFFTLMWLTGLRRGTLQRLQWSDIDWKGRRFRVRASADKAKDARWVPVVPAALEVLQTLPRGVGLIFGPKDFKKCLAAASERAGFPEVGGKTHVFRHARATAWLEQGGDLPSVQYLLGHKHVSTTARYIHPREDAAREMLGRMK